MAREQLDTMRLQVSTFERYLDLLQSGPPRLLLLFCCKYLGSARASLALIFSQKSGITERCLILCCAPLIRCAFFAGCICYTCNVCYVHKSSKLAIFNLFLTLLQPKFGQNRNSVTSKLLAVRFVPKSRDFIYKKLHKKNLIFRA